MEERGKVVDRCYLGHGNDWNLPVRERQSALCRITSYNVCYTKLLRISMVKTSPKRNSIIFSRMNTPLLVGESGYVTKEYPNLFLPDRLWNICCDEKNVNTRFVSQYLITEKMRNILKESATGTSETMKNISQSKFTDIQLFFPSLPEQQKIADCLSSLDELVTAQAQKIEALKNHKKGLMQQLFPAGDE